VNTVVSRQVIELSRWIDPKTEDRSISATLVGHAIRSDSHHTQHITTPPDNDLPYINSLSIIDFSTAGDCGDNQGTAMFDHDPRDRDNDDPRDVEAHWITLGRGSVDEHGRDPFDDVRDRGQDTRHRDLRDPFVATIELPRGPGGRRRRPPSLRIEW